MKTYYILLFKKTELGIRLPDFKTALVPFENVHVKDKVLSLEDNEYVDVARFSIAGEGTFITVEEYKLSNIDGTLYEEPTYQYTLPRHGRVEV